MRTLTTIPLVTRGKVVQRANSPSPHDGLTIKPSSLNESRTSVTDALTDDSLRALRGRDAELFSLVYRNCAPQVLGYLTARGVEDPEATMQEVFLAVLPRINDIRGGANGLRTFLFSVAHARMVDDHRRQSRTPARQSYEPEVDLRSTSSAEAAAMLLVAPGEVLELLQVLAEDQKEVLTLRIIADLTVEQVAEIMGKSAGAVKQLQRRALDKLREHSAVKDYVAP